MKIISINVSKPIEVRFKGRVVSTGIFKKPVQGSVLVHKHNLEGDGQADLTVHGGEHKAVYAYSLDHYAYWERVLNRDALPHGQFGENLTVEGLNETESCVGDHWQIGTAIFAITQPRFPCYKLGVRFNDDEMPKRFSKSALPGVYLRVVREGSIATDDEIKIIQHDPHNVPIKALFVAHLSPAMPASKEIYRRALQVAELAPELREKITARMR